VGGNLLFAFLSLRGLAEPVIISPLNFLKIPPYRHLTKIKKVFKYRKGKNFVIYAMRAMMHVSNPGRHRGYVEPSGVTGVAFFIPVLEVGKK
jgi:hypothetical protein